MHKKSFIRVDEWNPSNGDNKVSYDGKLMVIRFDKLFNKKNENTLNTFVIKKESYVKRLPELCHYINYFIKFYDKNNELLTAYLKLKSLFDNKTQNINLESAIKLIYSILLTDTIVKHINDMVEDNYYIDLSSNSDDVKYNETLEFKSEHAKILMAISISMKIMVPIMFHYLNRYNMTKNRTYIFKFYEGLFDIFGKEIDIYNKLFISIHSKVNVNFVRNKVIWGQREFFGVDPLIQMIELLKDKIISETIFKFRFDKNVVSFIYVVLDKQLRFFLIEPYKRNRVEVSAKKDVSGLSGLDKLEMNSAKIDESIVILSDVNIKKTIKRIIKKMHIEISKDEIQYYKENTKITKFQSQLVFYYYAKYFGGYRDLSMLNRTQYIKLLVILKKRLQYQTYVYLPEILTGNIETKLNARTIRNDKFLSKITSSSIYQRIIEDKYDTLKDMNKNEIIINMLSTLLNTTFTYVDYDNDDILNKPIEINQDMLSDEFLNFLNQL